MTIEESFFEKHPFISCLLFVLSLLMLLTIASMIRTCMVAPSQPVVVVPEEQDKLFLQLPKKPFVYDIHRDWIKVKIVYCTDPGFISIGQGYVYQDSDSNNFVYFGFDDQYDSEPSLVYLSRQYCKIKR